MVYPESVKKLEAIVTTDIQKTGHAEIVQGLIVRIRSVLRDAMNEQLGEARDVEAAIEVQKEDQVVQASVGFGENGSDGGVNENLGFGGGRGSHQLQDVADAERNPVQRRRKYERPHAAHSAQHLRRTLVSLNPLFNFLSLFHFSSHFSISSLFFLFSLFNFLSHFSSQSSMSSFFLYHFSSHFSISSLFLFRFSSHFSISFLFYFSFSSHFSNLNLLCILTISHSNAKPQFFPPNLCFSFLFVFS